MRTIIIASFIIIFLFFLVLVGLKIKPRPFPAFAKRQLTPATIPLPAGLPAPVERFFRATYGENIPIIKTAVISGRGTIKLFGITFPIRFRFTHEAGYNFRSDIDITFFAIVVMKGTERFVGGIGKGKTPGGVDEGEWFNQSANIRMWAEALEWFPSILITDSRVCWDAIDENTALVTIPYGNNKDHLLVRFDPKTSKVQFLEAMKYKNATTKMLWVNGIWMDDGKPFIHLDVEDVLYNVDVETI